MERKNMIIIGVIVVIIAIIGIVFATSALNNKNQISTPFDTEFMSGAFAGNAEKANTNESYVASFTDNEHNVTYNLTTVDNSSALMEIYQLQGVKGPEHRSFNGNNWNIYFGEAVPSVNNTTNVTSNESMGIVICECQKESQGYIIHIIFADLKKVNFTLNTFGDSYVNFVEPLLKTVNLKQSSNVPALHEQYGMSQADFQKQMDMVHQIKAGNYSALQQGT